MSTAVKYKSREEAQAAFRKMQERKRLWIKETEQELVKLRQIAL
jgi:hypothetical protein